MSGTDIGYIKQPPFGEFQTWVERELEAIERAISQRDTARWDDLRFPANGIDPVGLANPATRVTDLTTYPGGLSFSGSALNICAGVAQMPHSWILGTDIHPHIHWTQTTGDTGAVDWKFYYRMIGNVGDAAGAWLGPFDSTLEVGTQGRADQHMLSSFAAIDMTGRTESCMISWYIQRNGNTDANAQAAILLEFDIHYQSWDGSIQEYPSASPYSPTPGVGSLVLTGHAPTVSIA